MAIRLQKYLNSGGIVSRREAEKLIQEGRVRVNGDKAVLGMKVSQTDVITLDNKKIYLVSKKIYLILNKPVGYVTTRGDRHALKTVYDLLPKEYRKIIWPVGRLDKDSEGILIMTNDGELTQKLTHPSFAHEKEYAVLTDRLPTAGELRRLASGVVIDGQLTAPAQIHLENKIIFMTIHEGRNKQIRKMFAVLGIMVKKLKRVRIDKLELTNLAVGKYKLIKVKEIL